MKSGMMAVVAGLLIGAATMATAKEVTSGGGTGIVACSPVKALTAKGDARAGETGVATVQVGWSVTPCDKAQSVRVEVLVSDSVTKEAWFTNPEAGLDGKITVAVPARRGYACKVTVYDAATGDLVGSQTVYASTVPKGGV